MVFPGPLPEGPMLSDEVLHHLAAQVEVAAQEVHDGLPWYASSPEDPPLEFHLGEPIRQPFQRKKFFFSLRPWSILPNSTGYGLGCRRILAPVMGESWSYISFRITLALATTYLIFLVAILSAGKWSQERAGIMEHP